MMQGGKGSGRTKEGKWILHDNNGCDMDRDAENDNMNARIEKW